MRYLTPPFPIAGAGILAFETMIAAALVSVFWVSSPKGFAQLGGMMLTLLVASLSLAYSISAKVRQGERGRLETRARVFLVIGAGFALVGLVMGVLGGPHFAGVLVYGFAAQFITLIAGRISLAI
jgi:hypothetical protein